MTAGPSAPTVDSVDVVACRIPTDSEESDATLTWDSTTIVLVEAGGGGRRGLGWTYCDESAATLVRSMLAPVVRGRPVTDIAGAWESMVAAVRNAGRPGVASCAISAVDVALWDLRCRLAERSLAAALGAVRDDVALYGSGGFTSYPLARLVEQLSGWAADGFAAVKMKVGRHPADDVDRVAAVRAAIGDDVDLFVDANGAYGPVDAIRWALEFAVHGVSWFEEPVTSDDLDGLRAVRTGTPPEVEVAAGEYGYDDWYFRRMLEFGAVDCLQPDVTRCGGFTGLLRAGRIAETFGVDVSTHTAPQLSAHAGCAVAGMRHAEWFHDHVRIERMLFDGTLEPEKGRLRPDRARLGHGLEVRRDAIHEHAR